MPRKHPEQAKRTILDATVALLLEHGAGGVTIDRVAKRAGTAKGLVNYHFETKDRLLAAAVRLVSETRLAKWRDAFGSLDLQRAVDDTWQLILYERDDGLLRAIVSTYAESGSLVRTAVNETTAAFARTVAEGIGRVLRQTGVLARVPEDQLGWLVAAAVQGAGLQLASGVDPSTVERAYTAAWLGVLGMTE